MTEKTLNGIEIGLTTVFSAGIDFVVGKAINKAVDPQTIYEKILTGVGTAGVSVACNYGVYKVVHGVLNPNEEKKYEELVGSCVTALETNGELSKVMAEHEIKVENKVDDIYNQIMEGKVDG